MLTDHDLVATPTLRARVPTLAETDVDADPEKVQAINRRRIEIHKSPDYYPLRNHLIDFLVTRSKSIENTGQAPVEVSPGLEPQTQPEFQPLTRVA